MDDEMLADRPRDPKPFRPSREEALEPILKEVLSKTEGSWGADVLNAHRRG